MIDKPYDRTLTPEQMQPAKNWWRSLSTNQQKEFERQHFPNYQHFHWHKVYQIWEAEGKPQPQETTPISPEFM